MELALFKQLFFFLQWLRFLNKYTLHLKVEIVLLGPWNMRVLLQVLPVCFV